MHVVKILRGAVIAIVKTELPLIVCLLVPQLVRFSWLFEIHIKYLCLVVNDRHIL